jgi:hypothetical protein
LCRFVPGCQLRLYFQNFGGYFVKLQQFNKQSGLLLILLQLLSGFVLFFGAGAVLFLAFLFPGGL